MEKHEGETKIAAEDVGEVEGSSMAGSESQDVEIMVSENLIFKGIVPNKSGRKLYSCKYCNSDPIEHRDGRPIEHLTKCSQTSDDLKQMAHRWLLTKGFIQEKVPILPTQQSSHAETNGNDMAASSSEPQYEAIPVKNWKPKTLDGYIDHLFTWLYVTLS
ncbi:hypothetical protein CC1G_13295 [Coprinopsis cinerea okayama7|uniref:Uncharacterized protein n=1 Tax=Coprinopsis cinerea (strain Okayama-7 / 130 / ATCC MYA-4618 / FGSC 9003) TaxID=240176 RepID=A8PHD1_COPC7|nr:hypothetical protein CC1G_13295 [Coprinopsis cinerea okayama7\|eukprot:XP_001841385.2 hypothetical protein CC1G_13295 [Coprinopsis cinerea okayama7\